MTVPLLEYLEISSQPEVANEPIKLPVSFLCDPKYRLRRLRLTERSFVGLNIDMQPCSISITDLKLSEVEPNSLG